MISRINYNIEHINDLHKKSGNDPALIERVLFAFGLLESLRKTELPFIFKGGTSLILLLNEPKRLSTDIDIIVDPKVNIDEYLEKAEKIFPFVHKEEQIRKGNNDITKRHFKFYYDSPITGKSFFILLDVVFEDNPYPKVNKKEIANNLLLTEDENLFVDIPTINCMLGDKLSAFAPNTTGIPYGIDKDMEIIKQMLDVNCLIDAFDNQSEVSDSYSNAVKLESDFRGTAFTKEDCLKDAISTCLCICSRGKIDKQNYPTLLYGIRGLSTHIFGTRYSGELAAQDACRVLYFASCLLTGNPYKNITDEKQYLNVKPMPKPYNSCCYMKKINLKAFGYLVEASKLLDTIGIFS